MTRSEALWEQLKEGRLIALLSPHSTEECVLAYEALHPLGVVVEIALRTAAAIDGMKLLRDRYPEALFLAGTVMTPHQAAAAIDAGAAGIVSPDYLPAVVEAAVRRGVMCVPGGIGDAGKQLAQKAGLHGCTIEELKERQPHQWIYKLFPAVAGQVTNYEMARAWQAAYAGLTIVYTGGVNRDNLPRIHRSDPNAIICASALTRYLPDVDRTAAEARAWMDIIHAADPEPARPRKIAALQPSSSQAVVALGEIMLRLSPGDGRRLGQTTSLDATFGGSEANVAVSLAQWGLASRFVTALPSHSMGQAAINALRYHGVDTTHIARTGDRVGVYYLEAGASQRPSKVIYDRAGSAISQAEPGVIDWVKAFDGAGWFHFSGITPALSPTAALVTAQAVRAARDAGLRISIDLNYRAKLWSKSEATSVITPLMEYVDLVIGNEEDAASVFGIRAAGSDVEAGRLDTAAYDDVARQLVQRFDLSFAAITLRESRSASDNTWSACMDDGSMCAHSTKYDVHVVDRVGGGDAFAAGLIYGLFSRRSPRDALEFAVAASCLKQTIRGDFNLVSTAEVEALAAGDASGRIKR